MLVLGRSILSLLGGISFNFADTFIELLINYSQIMNWIDILVCDIFAFFSLDFMDLSAWTLIVTTSNDNQIT